MALERCLPVRVGLSRSSRLSHHGDAMAEWNADVGNDPEREYDLVIEIRKGNDYRGRVVRLESGELVLQVYPTSSGFDVPVAWLSKLLGSAERELPRAKDEARWKPSGGGG